MAHRLAAAPAPGNHSHRVVTMWDILFILLDFLTLLVDGVGFVAWYKSRADRIARRKAKEIDQPLPDRTGWSWLFILLFPAAFVLTLLVLLKWLPRLLDR
jgi:hypothetical protein